MIQQFRRNTDSEEIRKLRGQIIEKRMKDLNLSLRQVSEHFSAIESPYGHSYERVRQWQTEGVDKEQFLHICNELGIVSTGLPKRTVPEWIKKIQDGREEEQERKFSYRLQKINAAEAAKKLYRIKDKIIPKVVNGTAHSGSLKTLSETTQELGIYDPNALQETADRLQYFETSELNGSIKKLSHASTVLRKYWEASANDLSKAMPDKEYRLKRHSIYALESPNNSYGIHALPAQKTICNLLAGLYLLDKKQPKSKRVLKDSEALEFLAWAMKRNDPLFGLTHRLQIRVERAIDDVLKAAETLEFGVNGQQR